MTPPPPMPAYRTLQASENGESESTPPPQISASLPAEAFSRALASTGPTGVAISAGNPGFHFPPTAPSSAFGTGPVSNNPFATMTTTGAPPLSSDALNPSFGMFSPSIPPTGGGLPVGWHSVAASFATRANDLARRTLAPFQGPGYVGSGASFANQAFHSPVAPGSAPSPSRAGSELGGFVDTGASFGQEYEGKSHEECRLEDYAQNRKNNLVVGLQRREPRGASAAGLHGEHPGLLGQGQAYQSKSHEELRLEDYLKSREECSTDAPSQGSSSSVPEALTTTTPAAKSSLKSAVPPQQKGTEDPAWQPVLMEVKPTISVEVLMSISAIQEYATKSHEELRLEYYLQNRK